MHGSDRPAFLITIDTEGDNIWKQRQPGVAQTRNATYLHRFQELCERYGFKPTYLTNCEMARSEVFCELARDALARGTAEVGMHLHAWDSPPLAPLTEADHLYHPFLIDYPREQMRDKIAFMTDLLEDRFGVRMRSHRAGRWAFNEIYAELLIERGYCVDCSVTPGVSWKKTPGAPGRFGSDYTRFPAQPYFIDTADISKAGSSPLLQVPMSSRQSWAKRCMPGLYRGIGGRLLRRVLPETTWFRPDGRNAVALHGLVDWVDAKKHDHLEFMLHSSEFMPGGSHIFPNDESIERLYDTLNAVFARISRKFVGMTLSEYHDRFKAHRAAPISEFHEALA